MSMTVLEQIIQIMADVFDVEEIDSITATTTPDEVELWDSLGHMQLVAELEERFGVSFGMEEVVEMSSVAEIEKMINDKVG